MELVNWSPLAYSRTFALFCFVLGEFFVVKNFVKHKICHLTIFKRTARQRYIDDVVQPAHVISKTEFSLL